MKLALKLLKIVVLINKVKIKNPILREEEKVSRPINQDRQRAQVTSSLFLAKRKAREV